MRQNFEILWGGQKEEKRIRKEKSPWLDSLPGRNMDKTKRGNMIVSPKSFIHVTLIPGILLASLLTLSSAQTYLSTLDSDSANVYCTCTICQAHNATVTSITPLSIGCRYYYYTHCIVQKSEVQRG